jgi:hypothetical protein
MEREVSIIGGRLTTVSAGPSRTSRTKKTTSRSPRTRRSAELTADMPDPIVLVRELNHRVKNNFQIIVSLMNLRKRMMPPERREDLRFIEEHVQSMSVAYRLVYNTGSMTEVSLTELITDVLSGLRHIAGLEEDQLRFDVAANNGLIGLDHAIALALYLAVLMPPYLNEALTTAGAVTVTVSTAANFVTLSVRGTWGTPVCLELIRDRLMRAYAIQLRAELFPAAVHGAEKIRFVLERPMASSAI